MALIWAETPLDWWVVNNPDPEWVNRSDRENNYVYLYEWVLKDTLTEEQRRPIRVRVWAEINATTEDSSGGYTYGQVVLLRSTSSAIDWLANESNKAVYIGPFYATDPVNISLIAEESSSDITYSTNYFNAVSLSAEGLSATLIITRVDFYIESPLAFWQDYRGVEERCIT